MKPIPEHKAQTLAAVFLVTSLLLTAALAGTCMYAYRLSKSNAQPRLAGLSNAQASPLQVQYQLEVPGRGEIFPALACASPKDSWPVAVLTIAYVDSMYTFGNFTSEAERVRLPRETLQSSSANCIDVSVAFASAMENLGVDPVIVIVPGHAFTGVRLTPESRRVLYLDLTVLPDGTLARAISRADHWLKKTPPAHVLTIDVAAARALGIYPIPGPLARPS